MVAPPEKSVAQRLNAALTALNYPHRGRRKRLSDELGVSGEAARKWLSGETIPSMENAVRLATLARVDVEWLLTGRKPDAAHDWAPSGSRVLAWETLDDLPADGAYVTVPHYDVRLSAGDGAQWVEHADHELLVFRTRWFQAKGARPQDCRALYVHGASMEPTLLDGDTVLIDTTRTAIDDDAIYALLYHGELYIKRLFRLPGGSVELRSDNPRHPSRPIQRADTEHLLVLGRMIWRAG